MLREQLPRALLLLTVASCGSSTAVTAVDADRNPGSGGSTGGRRPGPALDGGLPDDGPPADASIPRDVPPAPGDAPRPTDLASDQAPRPGDTAPRPADTNSPPSGATTCGADGECVISAYRKPVLSEADCYCVLCPATVLNKATADLYAAQWRQQCTDWMKRVLCPVAACLQPPPTKCVAGQCKAGTAAVPMSCPGDSTCPGGGTRCGGACCRPSEWCDPELGACRCGSGSGCGRDECATGGPSGGSRCGSFCCGPASGRACPQ